MLINMDMMDKTQYIHSMDYIGFKIIGVPVVVQWLTNPTRNHEVAGSVPGLVQWVRDLVLL